MDKMNKCTEKVINDKGKSLTYGATESILIKRCQENKSLSNGSLNVDKVKSRE